MRIYATADLHGNLPEVPECDLLLIAGDICPVDGSHNPLDQREWLKSDFADWLNSIPARQVVGIAGNHDYAFADRAHPRDLRWAYLQDESLDFEGLKIWGKGPIKEPRLPGRNAPRHDPNEEFLRGKWALIPDDTDIIAVHGPPYGYGDTVRYLLYPGEDPHAGSKSLNDAIQRVRPGAVICGHIHEGYGAYRHDVDSTTVYNVSHVNADYAPVNALVEIET